MVADRRRKKLVRELVEMLNIKYVHANRLLRQVVEKYGSAVGEVPHQQILDWVREELRLEQETSREN